MLKIFNDLSIFFEDNYREFNIREYAKLMNISPPTASTLLKSLKNENVLLSRNFKNLILFRANRNSDIFIDLQKTYYKLKYNDLIEHLSQEFNHETIILFGSLIKAEARPESDIDLFINSKQKNINLEIYEKKYKRNIQLQFISALENTNLKINILKGSVLRGDIDGLV